MRNEEEQEEEEEEVESESAQNGHAAPMGDQMTASASNLASPSSLPSASPSSSSSVLPCLSSSVPFRRVTQSVSVWPRSSLYDLAVPSSRLFRDFTRSLVKEWRLDQLRTRDAVRSVHTVRTPDGEQWYLVEMTSGRRVLSWSVVCAVGNATPRWPEWTGPWRQSKQDTKDDEQGHKTMQEGAATEEAAASKRVVLPAHALIHSSEAIRRCFERSPSSASASPPAFVDLSSHLPPTPLTGRLLVVGGGLTSAQLCCQLLRSSSCSWSVDWCVRGWVRVKAFDVDLEWVSPSSSTMCMAHFHALHSHEDKIKAIRAARQGGSITQEAQAQIEQWRQANRLKQREHTQVHKMEWITETTGANTTAGAAGGFWRVYLQRHLPPAHSHSDPAPIPCVSAPPLPLEVFECDAVWLCTGSAPDVRSLPFLHELTRTHQLHEASGLPIVDQHLTWTGKQDSTQGGTNTGENKNSGEGTNKHAAEEEEEAAAGAAAAASNPIGGCTSVESCIFSSSIVRVDTSGSTKAQTPLSSPSSSA